MKMCPKSKSFTRSPFLLPRQIKVRCPLTSTVFFVTRSKVHFLFFFFYFAHTSSVLCLCCFTLCIYLLWGGGATAIQVAFLCFFAETQDDLEAITNEIKKMANNARNKLKSESAQPRIKWLFGAFSSESEYSKMI